MFRSISRSASTMALPMHSSAATKAGYGSFMPTQLVDSTYVARAIRPLRGSVTDLVNQLFSRKAMINDLGNFKGTG